MKFKLHLLQSFILCSSLVFAQPATLPAQFKVVGYYFLMKAQQQPSSPDSGFNFLDKITHLNIAFINPDTAGNFADTIPLQLLIQKAHEKNVKVLASIGGGGSHAYYANLLTKKNRPAFMANLLSMRKFYNFDGIDVDLEGSDIDANYEKFVVDLAAALRKEGKLITAAIGTAYKDQLTDKALQQYDFVNIMSYDRTGPWRPSEPGEHSPYSMAVNDLNYWHKERNIPKNKMVLGLPFYGYGFSAEGGSVISMNYNDISMQAPDKSSDVIVLPGNIIMYFNNLLTIQNKTILALEKAGGVMIWHLTADAVGDRSLLNIIDIAIHAPSN